MSLCEGRPGGPCPKKALGAPSQGDMFLCKECEEFRFPYLRVARSTKDNGKSQNVNKVSTRSSRSSQTTKQNAAVATESRPTPVASSGNSEKVKENCASSLDCPECNEATDSTSIECDICLNHFHPLCTGLSTDVFDILISIVAECGWTCYGCRTTCRSKLNHLQSALANTNESVCDMKLLVNEIKLDVDHLKSATNQPNALVGSAGTATADAHVAPNLSQEIHNTIADITRRKRNIVVSGLPENDDYDNANGGEDPEKAADKAAFLAVCEEHFSIKPSLSKAGCQRLGKRVEGSQRPRKLLVHLDSELSASTLLEEARKLRKSTDSYIAENVYMNPDLSPAGLKLAYNKRRQRRLLQQSRQLDNQSDNHGTEVKNVIPVSDIPETASNVSDLTTSNNLAATANNSSTSTLATNDQAASDITSAPCTLTASSTHRSYTVVHSSFRNR